MAWWIVVTVAVSGVLLPAFIVDLVLGRRSWGWAFGFPVAADGDEAVWRGVQTLRLLNASLAVVTAGAVLFVSPLLSTIVIFLYWVVLVTAWLRFARPHIPAAQHPQRFVVDLGAPSFVAMLQPKWEVPNWLLVLLPIALTPLVMGYLPTEIPMHWGASGQVDRFGSPAELYWVGVWGVPAQLMMWGVMAIIARGATPRLPQDKAEELRPLVAEEKRIMLLMMQWVRLLIAASALGGWVALVLVGFTGNQNFIWPFVGLILLMDPVLLAVVGYWIYKLIGIKAEMKQLGFDPAADRGEGYVWGGMFYSDPSDPALWVPKRIGIGYTMNMARPAAKIIMGASLLLVVVSAVIPFVLM